MNSRKDGIDKDNMIVLDQHLDIDGYYVAYKVIIFSSFIYIEMKFYSFFYIKFYSFTLKWNFIHFCDKFYEHMQWLHES